MKYTTKLPTMAEITNWYLYKQEDILAEEERLDFSRINTPEGKRIEVDTNLFMNKETGPGRFITAADFSFIKMFFKSEDYIYTDIHEVSQNPLTNLKNGTRYSKREILTI